MAPAELGQRRVAADLEILVEGDAAVGESSDAAPDDLLFELEAGDAVGEETARPVVAIVDVDVIALDPERFGGAQAGRAGADDADRLAGAIGERRERRDPALLPRGVGDELLDRADGDRAVTGELDYAIAFAQPVLRADAAADLGHRRRRVGQFVSLSQPALGGETQPVGDVVMKRTMRLTVGHAALRAA